MQIAGLEINQSRIAILALKKTGKFLRVLSRAEKELPEGVIIDGKLKKPELFIELLEELKKEAKPKKISTRYVIVALPEELIYLTTKPFPDLEEGQIREALELNINEFLPGKTDEIFWGYQLTNTKGEILLSSINKDDLNVYLNSLGAAKLIPSAVEPSSLSALRAFDKIDQTMVIEMNSKSVMVSVIANQSVFYSGGFPFSEEDFVKKIKRILNFYQSKKNLEKVEILISGNRATPEVVEYLKVQLSQEVKLAEGELVFKDPQVKTPVLLGVALRGLMEQKEDNNLSLLPIGTAEGFEEKQTLHSIGAFANLITITCILFILIFYGFIGLLYYLNFSLDKQLANVSQAKVSPQTAQIKKQMQTIEPKITYLSTISKTLKNQSEKVKNIAESKGEEIIITNMVLAKGSQNIVVTGTADSRDALASFKDDLAKNKDFSKVDLSSTNVAEGSITFTINITTKA